MACFGELRHCYAKCSHHYEDEDLPEKKVIVGCYDEANADDEHPAGTPIYDTQFQPRRDPLDWTRVGPPGAEYLDRGREQIREFVYMRAAAMPWNDICDLMPQAKESFGLSGWASGFGGERWEGASQLVCTLIDLIVAFHNDPTAERYRTLMQHANLAANAVHNGGRLTHKIIPQYELDVISQWPQMGFANAPAGAVTLFPETWMKELLS
jgi:hypothetical protein